MKNISIKKWEMVQTAVTPQKTDFDMSISLPIDYVGKKVHVLFYIDDEVKNTTASVVPKQKPSNFFGTLSREDGEKMQAYLAQSCNE